MFLTEPMELRIFIASLFVSPTDYTDHSDYFFLFDALSCLARNRATNLHRFFTRFASFCILQRFSLFLTELFLSLTEPTELTELMLRVPSGFDLSSTDYTYFNALHVNGRESTVSG